MSDGLTLMIDPRNDTLRGALRSALNQKSPRNLQLRLTDSSTVAFELHEVLGDNVLVGRNRTSPSDSLLLIPFHAILTIEAN